MCKNGKKFWSYPKKIERYTPQGEDWYELEDILEELYASERPELGLESMISIFEKYPNEDNDILWLISQVMKK